MSNFKKIIILILGAVFAVGLLILPQRQAKNLAVGEESSQNNQVAENPLAIEAMRQKSYPGSELVIEQTLSPGSNYNQYLVSYLSDGLKIYGLLTMPMGDPSTGSGQGPPVGGWPVIIFNHGYIPLGSIRQNLVSQYGTPESNPNPILS